jgi:hypothetical protein
MKHLKYFAGLVIVSAALMFASTSESVGKMLATDPVDYYLKEITADTITTTESDTIRFAAQFLGSWLPVFKFETTQLSGTQNLSVVFQESHKTTGNTDWFAVGSAVTTSGSTDSDIFRYASATTPVASGVRFRVIITGTGTQSTRYTGRLVAKRLN